jgi:RNA polymerase sigma factor (sigma-70 family)
MCKVNGIIDVQAAFRLVNMTMSPLTKKGEWRKTVLKMADALNVLPDDLFNERQKVLTLGKNTSSRDVTESEMLAIAEQYVQDDRLEDLQDNSAVREIAEEQVTNLLNSEILDVLSPRQREVLEMRFGFDGSPGRTLEEIGTHFGVSKERIRSIEGQAFRRIRAVGGHAEEASRRGFGERSKRIRELKELVLEHD